MAWSFDTQLSSETTLGSLPCTASRVNAGEATRTLENLFMNDSAVPGVLVIKDAGLLGMVSRGKFLEIMGRPFGREVFWGRPIAGMLDDFMHHPLILDEQEKVHDAARLALQRAPEARYEPVVVHLAGARANEADSWGIVDVALLLQAQSQILTGQIESLKRAEADRERLQQQLLTASRQAGMAEVATGVLHNVGNVLNGVTVSTNLITERLKKSKVGNLGKATAMMQEHKDSLGNFLTGDERGKALPGYLLKLSDFLTQEQQLLVEEVDGLARSVEHIREIVTAQQSYAKVSTVKQRIELTELLDEALRINSVSLERHHIEVIRQYVPLPPLMADKHQIMQILVNLVSNAKNALRDSRRDDPCMTLRVESVEIQGHRVVRLTVTDNGVGVPEENLTRLFQHGFTTRMDGHGFGLHNAANTAHQMGGSLMAASAGPGRGASFTLELPYETSEAGAIMLMHTENRRILIIDDTESIHRDFRKTLLRSSGSATLDGDETQSLFGEVPKSAWQHTPFMVDSAMQGQDGFAKVRQAKAEGQPYALAFVDMRMPPGWDGVQTIKNLWREDPNLQVVICTAHSDYSWEQIVEELGVSDRLLILKKPFDNAEVCQLANALTEKWQLSKKAQMNVDELTHLVEERTRELRHLAMHDKLTGLANRALMTEQLKDAIAKARQGEKFALLFLDFDRFKVVNDSLGHHTGDMLLVAIADRIRQTLDKNYTAHAMAARLGGDEFTVLLSGLTDVNKTMEFVADLRTNLHKPHVFRGHEVFSTVSIGITNSDIGYTQPEDVLRDADNAMYRAKMAGKDRYMVFDRSMHEAACARLEIESDLSRAMEREEIMLHYQPIVNIETGRIQGFEALCRWQHPVRGMVPPSLFIPVAEEMGLICRIGEWAMREACLQLAQWRMAYPDAGELYMSVNLSKRQVVENVLLRQVKTALAETGLPARCLRLEVTESLIMDNPGQIIPLLEQLRQAGVGLSIDDFGTGHSSLTWLSQFPVDVLKIDRGFITQLNEARQFGAIIQAIVSLAGNLNMQVTAEGVERPDQLAQIQAMECQSAQGYLFSPAVPAEQCAAMLAERKSFARNAAASVLISA